MLGEFSWEEELYCSLDFSGGEGSSFVVSDQLGGFEGDSFKQVVDEGVHDVHGFLGDTSFGMHLLEDFVDVDREGFVSSSSGLLFFVTLGVFSFGVPYIVLLLYCLPFQIEY